MDSLNRNNHGVVNNYIAPAQDKTIDTDNGGEEEYQATKY